MFRQKPDLTAVEAEPAERRGIGQHLVRIEIAADRPQIMIVVGEPGAFGVRVGNHRNAEFLRVFQQPLITRPGDVVGTEIGVESIRQAVAPGEHMAAIPSRSFEKGDVQPGLHQLVAATEARDPGAAYHDLAGWRMAGRCRFRRSCRRHGARIDHGSAGTGEQRLQERPANHGCVSITSARAPVPPGSWR